jgi:FkbH-like protein
VSHSSPALSWLPPPDDWNARIAAIERMDASGEAWIALQQLAATRLDFIRTERLDRALRAKFGGSPPPGLATAPVRLAVLGSSTTAHLAVGVRVAGLRRGLWITVWEPEYGQYRQSLVEQDGPLRAFSPTAILFALDAYHLLGGSAPRAAGEVGNDLRALWREARASFGCQVIQQTTLPLFPDLMGSNEHRLAGSSAAEITRLNPLLRDLADEEEVDLLAVDAGVARYGIDAWHDPRIWHRSKQEISPAAVPIYGDLLGRLLAAAQGRSYKCLVLDLDNTLWGGVIGDDGLDGIVIGQGSAAGEAFAAFQAYAVRLAERGVILAVCSKNDEVNALAPFLDHPEMLLKQNHLSAFVANWRDKATNLREIAQSLNIGLDSLVFVDDNPFERQLVRRELPMVAVPELPDDPSSYAQCLGDAGFFEALSVTKEDNERTRLYAENRRRVESEMRSTDIGAYLQSLDMRLMWRHFDRVGQKRIVQLINKTNQFNLTTRRYAEQDIQSIIDDPDSFGLQFRLLDAFGDNGVIAIVVGRRIDAETVEIDTWLMSCRVLGRQVEEATLEVVMDVARSHGASRLIGWYRPTAKNGMVADLYPRLGFAACGDRNVDQGQAFERVILADSRDLPMKIEQY